MKALVTGASSGIGKEMSLYLSELGYELILVGRDITRLKQVQKMIKPNSIIIKCDISNSEECINLYNQVKQYDIDILINNAGFGMFGNFNDNNLEQELQLIDTNIKGLHILTKLFLKDFIKKDQGYILNVASIGGFTPGPLMASYYASKVYVLNLTLAIYQEIKQSKNNVYIGCLCPGPVDTNFNNIARVNFNIKPTNSKYVAKYGINKMFKRKVIIIPTLKMKILAILIKFMPKKLVLKITYKTQSLKIK